jgi:PqqD family protein of HPr-rel-A system
VRFRAVGDEGVLVHLESGRAVVLNETGLHILQQLERGPRSPAELADSLVETFEVEASQASKDLAAFLAELDAEQILGGEGKPG